MRAENLPTFEIDHRLRLIAVSQLGLVTVQQAALVGVDRSALMRRRQAGALAPVFRNVLRIVPWPSTAEQRILGSALAVPGSMVAATSAAVVHGLPVSLGVDRPIVSSTLSRSARTSGILAIRHSFLLPSQPWHSVRVATPASTLVLLPRFLDHGSVERCIDHCIVSRLITADRVLRLIDELPRTALSGRRYLVELLEQRLGGVGHRSRIEQRVARWIAAAGLSGWKRNFNVPVGGGESVEVDFAWASAKVALEVSPFFTHGSRATQQRDIERRRLLVMAGWRVVEATDPDLESQRAFDRTLGTIRSLLKPGDLRALRAAERDEALNLGLQRRAG